MRIRTVKPEWLEDDRVLELSDAARVLSVALLLLADDHGRGRCGKAAAAQVWPDDPARFDGALKELEPWFVRRYVVRGQAYFEVLNFAKHQRINRPGGPRFPDPNEGEYLAHETFSESSVSPHCMITAGSDPNRDPNRDPIRSPFASSSENQTTPPDESEALITVECVGGSWTLRRSKLDEWEGTFGEVVDVASEVRAALQWLRDNPAKRKTPKGMARFIGSWLRRAVDSGRARPRAAGRSQGLSAEEILRLAAEDDAA